MGPAQAASSSGRILIVDDSEELRTSFEIGLTSAGFEVLVASTADEAFELVRDRRPDLVLTDIMLAGESGLDLITRIRSDLAPPQPIVVALSGFPDFEEDALRRGAVAFLTKPEPMSDLIAAIGAALSEGAKAPSVYQQSRNRSKEIRASVVQAAEDALRELAPNRSELRGRLKWGLDWLPGYFGFGTAIGLVVEDGRLNIEATGDAEAFPQGSHSESLIPFGRDIVESGSSLLLPDALPFAAIHGAGPNIRFFAGVPFFAPNGIPIGAICFVDRQPRHFTNEDLGILDTLGRRGSERIGALIRGADVAPVFEETGLFSRWSFETVLGIELRRARRHRLVLDVMVLSVVQRPAGHSWPDQVTRAIGAERVMATVFNPSLVAVFVSRPEGQTAANDLQKVIDIARDHLGLRGGGALSIEGRDSISVREEAVVRIVTALAEEKARAAHGEVERIVLRREAWPPSVRFPSNHADTSG